MNHPEYLPEKKTEKQIIEDAKRTVEAIRLTLNDWEYTIPQGMLATILDRVEYLKDTLQELVKGDADEDDVQDQAFLMGGMGENTKAVEKKKIQ